jgi:hypothetical protein
MVHALFNVWLSLQPFKETVDNLEMVRQLLGRICNLVWHQFA